MNKKAYFFIDDIIWLFRDLSRQRPSSMFNNPFLRVLKTAHDRFGIKTQLNVFYRTDFYYGNDEFTLANMTDAYKTEWEAASDWLKLGFHSKQEFPDYPYVNASYDDVKSNFDTIKDEVLRFAGENSFAYATVVHWLPMSKEGCFALKNGGIKIISATYGEKTEYCSNLTSLPYGVVGRLLQNRKPESGLFNRETRKTQTSPSLCSYNHLTTEMLKTTLYSLNAILDEETGVYFKRFCNGPVLNSSTLESLPGELAPLMDKDYIGIGLHEQYFYPEYYGYQPDYAEKIYLMGDIVTKNDFEFFFVEELV